ncbi:MAG: hypothetical protein BRC47_04885, partial [Cyanobacteria bacterium QS_7_48_42]
ALLDQGGDGPLAAGSPTIGLGGLQTPYSLAARFSFYCDLSCFKSNSCNDDHLQLFNDDWV